jgi:hypothetical protein
MEEILTTSISIPINKINKSNIDGTIRNRMKFNYEKKCNSHGYILKNSLEIINRSIGKVVSYNNVSSITYNINYKCTILNPCKGDEYECYIDSLTKMGIIAYLRQVKNTTYESLSESPLLIIIPKDYMNDVDIDAFKINQKIKVRVLDSRSRYKSSQIQVVSELIE